MPLMDRTHTPRGARKLITLDRTRDKEPWMHTRNNSENFNSDSFAIKGDLERDKILKKLIKKQKRKIKRNASPVLNNTLHSSNISQ